MGPLLCTLLAVVPQAFRVQGLERKLDAGLLRQLATARSGEYLPVDIVLREQVPPSRLHAVAAQPDKPARRAQVVAELKRTAQASRTELLAFLAARQAEGSVRGEIGQLWIHNVVTAEVAPVVVLELAARADVALIHHDPPRGMEVLCGSPTDAEATPTCGVERIRAPAVWSELGLTGQGVVVGVVDTGLCTTHPDIRRQLWKNLDEVAGNGIDDDHNGFVDDMRGWNFAEGNADFEDVRGHGSHVSGTVAGDGTSGQACGVAPDAQIMALKCVGSATTEAMVWAGLQYGVENGADVLTGSLGWTREMHPQRALWRSVCDNTIAAGVVVLFAAGNEGCAPGFRNVRTPGDVPDVITVGATDCNDFKMGFSSCGPVTWWSVEPYLDHLPPGLTKPDVMAPGEITLSHLLCSGYTTDWGTSMSTPHVAGVAALLLQADPGLDHFGLKALLEETSIDLGAAGKDNLYGSGRVDAYAAAKRALSNPARR